MGPVVGRRVVNSTGQGDGVPMLICVDELRQSDGAAAPWPSLWMRGLGSNGCGSNPMGSGCSLGVRDFDPWPNGGFRLASLNKAAKKCFCPFKTTKKRHHPHMSVCVCVCVIFSDLGPFHERGPSLTAQMCQRPADLKA